MAGYRIRRAKPEDAAEISRLVAQLGYPASADAMRARIERLLDSTNDFICVAESVDGGLMGWIHGLFSQFLESDFRAEIVGLVVDEAHFRQGIGRALVESIEAWARANGVTQTIVRCRTERADAHLFYERLGFNRTKTQVVFRKAL